MYCLQLLHVKFIFDNKINSRNMTKYFCSIIFFFYHLSYSFLLGYFPVNDTCNFMSVMSQHLCCILSLEPSCVCPQMPLAETKGFRDPGVVCVCFKIMEDYLSWKWYADNAITHYFQIIIKFLSI